MNLLHDHRGETLVEVLIALVVLIMGAFAGVKLLGLAVINTQVAEERVIATNLAREGLEAVRSIRDTNWLRYAGERRHCWNNYDDPAVAVLDCVDADDDNAPDTPIAHEQPYIVDFDPDTYKWYLTAVAARLDLLSSVTGDGSVSYQLQVDPTTGLYMHTTTGTGAPYFREVYIEYLDDYGRGLTTAAPPESANVLRATATVGWSNRGRHHEVVLTTILTDYLGRTNHD